MTNRVHLKHPKKEGMTYCDNVSQDWDGHTRHEMIDIVGIVNCKRCLKKIDSVARFRNIIVHVLMEKGRVRLLHAKEGVVGHIVKEGKEWVGSLKLKSGDYSFKGRTRKAAIEDKCQKSGKENMTFTQAMYEEGYNSEL